MRRNLSTAILWADWFSYFADRSTTTACALVLTFGSVVATATEVPAPATERLAAKLAEVRQEVESLAVHSAPPVLVNPGFEQEQLSSEKGWQFAPVEGGKAQVDPDQAYEGQQSVHLASSGHVDWAGPVVSIRSAAFQLPATRRMAVTAWMRVDPDNPPAAVWLLLEGKYKGQPFSHHVEVNSDSLPNGLPPLSSEWAPVTLQLDELPNDGITDLVVGVDLRGAGDVWVDNMQLSDMWLSDDELRPLVAKVDAAEADLAAGKTANVQKLVAVDLPSALSKYAAAEYLVPSLAEAAPAALAAVEAAEQAAAAAKPVVGTVVAQQDVINKQAQATDEAVEKQVRAVEAAVEKLTRQGRQPVTPIGPDEKEKPAAGQTGNTATAGSQVVDGKPTVLAAKSSASSVPGIGNEATRTSRTKSPAGSSATVATRTNSPPTAVAAAAASSQVADQAEQDRPWWKIWGSNDSDDQEASAPQRQVARTMPGTQYRRPRSTPNAARAARAAKPEASGEIIDLPQEAFRKLRNRFSREDQAPRTATTTVGPDDAEESTDRGFASRFRLPFFGSDDEQETTAAAPTDEERRFSLFGLIGDPTADARAAGTPSAATAHRDPFVSQSAAQSTVASATNEEEKESRLASFLKIFRSDDSETVTR